MVQDGNDKVDDQSDKAAVDRPMEYKLLDLLLPPSHEKNTQDEGQKESCNPDIGFLLEP